MSRAAACSPSSLFSSVGTPRGFDRFLGKCTGPYVPLLSARMLLSHSPSPSLRLYEEGRPSYPAYEFAQVPFLRSGPHMRGPTLLSRMLLLFATYAPPPSPSGPFFFLFLFVCCLLIAERDKHQAAPARRLSV